MLLLVAAAVVVGLVMESVAAIDAVSGSDEIVAAGIVATEAADDEELEPKRDFIGGAATGGRGVVVAVAVDDLKRLPPVNNPVGMTAGVVILLLPLPLPLAAVGRDDGLTVAKAADF